VVTANPASMFRNVSGWGDRAVAPPVITPEQRLEELAAESRVLIRLIATVSKPAALRSMLEVTRADRISQLNSALLIANEMNPELLREAFSGNVKVATLGDIPIPEIFMSAMGAERTERLTGALISFDQWRIWVIESISIISEDPAKGIARQSALSAIDGDSVIDLVALVNALTMIFSGSLEYWKSKSLQVVADGFDERMDALESLYISSSTLPNGKDSDRITEDEFRSAARI